GRPAGGALPAARPRRGRGRRHPGRGLLVPNAQARRRHRGPADAARPRPPGRARDARRGPGRGAQHADREDREDLMSTVEENPLTQGLERLPVHPTTLVIFGATGDLSRRKLLPALYNLAHEGSLPERFNLIGVSRSEKAHEE